MSNGSGSNTINSTVVLTDIGPSNCIDNDVMQEIIERLQGTISFPDPSSIVQSISAPTDTSKIWFKEDSTGKTTNIFYFDSLTGQWEDVVSTDPDNNNPTLCEDNNALTQDAGGCIRMPADQILGRSTASDNVITFDSEGDLYVKEETIRDLATLIDEGNSCNILYKDATSSALGVDRGANFFQHIGVPGSIISGHEVIEVLAPTPDPSIQTLDLTTIPNINWNSACPPTHVQVHAIIVIGAGSMWSSGTWAAPAAEICCGFDMTRVSSQIDSDSTEGSDANTAIVKLDPSNPELFTFRVRDIAVTDYAQAKNYMALFIQGLVWTSPPPA